MPIPVTVAGFGRGSLWRSDEIGPGSFVTLGVAAQSDLKVKEMKASKIIEVVNRLAGLVRPGMSLPDTVTEATLEPAIDIMLAMLDPQEKPDPATESVAVMQDMTDAAGVTLGLRQGQRPRTRAIYHKPTEDIEAARKALGIKPKR